MFIHCSTRESLFSSSCYGGLPAAMAWEARFLLMPGMRLFRVFIAENHFFAHIGQIYYYNIDYGLSEIEL